jgi:hypothetical protein
MVRMNLTEYKLLICGNVTTKSPVSLYKLTKLLNQDIHVQARFQVARLPKHQGLFVLFFWFLGSFFPECYFTNGRMDKSFIDHFCMWKV